MQAISCPDDGRTQPEAQINGEALQIQRHAIVETNPNSTPQIQHHHTNQQNVYIPRNKRPFFGNTNPVIQRNLNEYANDSSNPIKRLRLDLQSSALPSSVTLTTYPMQALNFSS